MKNPANTMAIVAELKRMVINHSQFQSAYQKLLSAYEMNLFTGMPEHIICVGQSGTGKSTLKDKIKADTLPKANDEKFISPVLIVNTPSLPTVKNLAEEMLICLGDVRFYAGSTIQKTNRVYHFIRQCEVKMIIFDELQHFIDRGKERQSLEVADWLKTVVDQSRTSVVLMGLERCEHLFQINEQLRRRFSKRIDIPPFRIDTQQSYLEFVGIIAAILEKMDLAELFDFKDVKIIRSIYYATNGVIANVMKLFIGAYELSKSKRYRAFDNELFEAAFTENIWVNGTGQLNPFNKQFCWNFLDEPGMPFHRSDAWMRKGGGHA